MSNARKLILIPEYRPLWAMAKCYGPTRGPLTKPWPTPVDIIGKLLLQSGKDEVTIYEVCPDPKNPKTMLSPVRLTLDNYMLPYETIAGMKSEPEVIVKPMQAAHPPVIPKIITVKKEPQPENTPVQEESKVDQDVEPVEEVHIPKSTTAQPQVPPEVAEDPVAESTTSEPTRLSKAERRRLRKEGMAVHTPAATETAATNPEEPK